MARMVRFEAPVDPNHIQASAQALFAAIQRQLADDRAELEQKIDQISRGEMPGDCAGPDQTFPIAAPADVRTAWRQAAQADDPAQVRANIRRIATQYGWQEALPDGE